nr:hypothetical protein [Tanacetum cinerariifolium]
GNTNTHSDISLPDYGAFYFDDDHIKEISSGSPTTQSDISFSEYDSFIFDFAHEEFVDELAHIISPSEYDFFYFKDLPDPGELMFVLNFGIRENLLSTTSVNLPIEDDHSPLLAYVVWIFLACLMYPVIPPYLHLFGNEDTIFDPGITINHFYSFKPGLSHWHGAFKKFNTHRSIPDTMCDVHLDNNHTPLEAKDHVEIVINSNDDISSSDDDSLHEENIKYVEASPHNSELVSLEAAEIVISEVEEIEDDNLREKLLNVHLLIANIEALKDNPTHSSELLTKSSSTSLNSFLEETNTFHNSLPEFENFYFDLGEISSGSTTTHSDISLRDYEAFYFDDDHIKEISSGSTTTHFDISLSENDSDLPDPSELMSVLNSGIRENLLSTTLVNLPIKDDHSPLLAYVVWIFLAYLTYPVIPPYLHPFGNEDTIFDPGITINHFYSFKPGSSHRHEAFKKFNIHRSHLNEWPMIINGKNTPILDVLLFHFYPL